MDATSEKTAVEREIAIAASPETIWQFLVDEEKATRWMGQGDRPEPRYGTRMACVGDALYLFGGSREKGPRLNDLYRFSPERRRWTQLEASSGERPSPRYAPALVTIGQRLYLFGGGNGIGGYLNDLHVYDPAADRWEKLAPKGEIPGPRGCPLPLCLDDNRLYLFSGAQSSAAFGSWVNGDLYCYDVAENQFSKLHESLAW